ncbi:hypothetical protein [Parabacteroides sp. ZJ-118]|uniref:hypothetical protein n=1 Tax=Parabacteroides sp. ZJ-118 TaxID=2709398 RepID=UPI0013EAAC6C|nr:hypothetical protein [Parabacteroides sp. ZJ-118]
MDNHKDTAPQSYVSEAKYAELMALYRAALSSAAEKDERLMAEQVLRNELVERGCAGYKASLEAKFDEERRKEWVVVRNLSVVVRVLPKIC